MKHSPNRERIPQDSHTSKETPTLPEFFKTPFGEIKMPLPTMVPMPSAMTRVRVTFLLRKTASSASSGFFFFLQDPISCSKLPTGGQEACVGLELLSCPLFGGCVLVSVNLALFFSLSLYLAGRVQFGWETFRITSTWNKQIFKPKISGERGGEISSS